jgi:UDP-N-acetylmuramyl-tripeptide synthetase
MRLGELLAKIPELEVVGQVDPDARVVDVAFDSREVRPGTVFVALVGAEADGHKFIESARVNGAVAVICQRGNACTDAIVCDDTRALLPRIAATVYGFPSLKLRTIGVTGTNGKTTTSFLLEQVLSYAKRSVGVVGTVSYRWPGHEEPAANTTPESATLQRLMATMVEQGVSEFVMEVSSHGLATHRVEETFFDAVVFTNFTQDHLDFHLTMQGYRDAKAKLFGQHVASSLQHNKSPLAVINLDDSEGAYFAELARMSGANVMTYGLNSEANFNASDIHFDVSGTSFRVTGDVFGRTVDMNIQTPLLGAFNVENLLAVIATALGLGISARMVVEGVRQAAGSAGRLERALQTPPTFVDYAHTPDALESVLETLRPLTLGRLIVVCGCGGDRDRAKRPLMARAAEAADVVVLTSDNPRTEDPEAILDDMVRDLTQPVSDLFPEATGVIRRVDRREAIREALRNATSNDVVLIAGKGHETYQEVGGERRPFNDILVAQDVKESG